MRKLLSSLMIVAVMLAAVGAGAVQAGAYETAFTTSITYQNIGTATANSVAILFYDSPTDPTPTVVTRPPLAQNGGTSIFIGSVGDLASGFRGTAVMTSDQPLAATLVQVGAGTAIKARPLSNGFSSGTPQSLIATYFKLAGLKSILSVQNAGNADTTITLKFYAVGATSPTYTATQLIKQGAGYYVDAGTTSIITGATFEGSVVVETAGGTGSIVASVVELSSGAGVGAKAFEGVGQGATTFYMPSALCTTGAATTYYAVQNTSTSLSATVTVSYSGGYTQNATILAGNKASFNTCAAAGIPGNYNGSAVIQSTNGTPIIAIGKVSGAGLATAFGGVASGASKLALPYIRYADSNQWFNLGWQRAFIAIQNLGADIPAGSNILVKYYNPNGTLAGTHTIGTGLAQFAKTNSNATNAGLTTFGFAGGSSGGSVVIEGPVGSQLAAVARVVSYSGSVQAGEDYNGIPMP